MPLPLHCIKRYSSLFHFLLSLRRAQITLQQSWAVLMTLRAHTHSLQSVWQLRAHMGFLVDNLQYYVQVNELMIWFPKDALLYSPLSMYNVIHNWTVLLQVDVLETQYSILVEKIKSTHDFENVKNAHSEFLSTLESQLFFCLDAVSDDLQSMRI